MRGIKFLEFESFLNGDLTLMPRMTAPPRRTKTRMAGHFPRHSFGVMPLLVGAAELLGHFAEIVVRLGIGLVAAFLHHSGAVFYLVRRASPKPLLAFLASASQVCPFDLIPARYCRPPAGRRRIVWRDERPGSADLA